MPKARIPISERFAALYVPEPNSGCWLWEGSLNEIGYGLIWVNERGGRAERAHRVSVELSGRRIESGKVVRHTCDNRCCVNPEHLIVGTAKENARDCIARGRNAAGERAGRAKLTEKDVRAIRDIPKGTRHTASMFGVSRCTLSAARNKKTWSHI